MVKKERIVLIDALRGLALAGILLIHHIEHFNFYKKPDYKIDWLLRIDQWVWDKVFLLVAGKCFALFSLLFGVSFWIIHENRKAKGESYFIRHFWRMILLFLIGIFHIFFFRGDILVMYAIIGIPLVISPYLNKKLLLGLSIVLLINPISIYTLITHFNGAPIFDFRLDYPNMDTNKYLTEGTFWEVLKFNLWPGYDGSIVWSWNVGRFFIIPGLFFLGAYFGRIKAFTDKPLKFWYNMLSAFLISWIVFEMLNSVWIGHIDDNVTKQLLRLIIDSYYKLSMLFVALSLIVVFWKHNTGNIWVSKFSDFGRMGLTNYVLMSVIGSVLYYGWGFGLYKYCGSLFTLGIGIAALVFQMKLSSWWLRKYGQGPLERLWRKLTWMKL